MEYRVRAFHDRGGVATFSLHASGVADATRQARHLGYTVLSAQPKRAFSATRRRFPLVLFTQQLLALLAAGLTLVEALDALTEKESRPEVRSVLAGVIAHVREGRSLSQALAAEPGMFPPLYVASVRAAERTGDLHQALSRYLEYHAQIDRLRSKLISASIYPALLVVVGTLAVAFLGLYVVPRFSQVYADVGVDLPLASRLLLEWGRFAEQHTLLLAGVLIFGSTALALIFSQSRLRERAHAMFARAGERSTRLRVFHLARFYRTLGMLLRGGTPVLVAFDMAAGLLPPTMREQAGCAATDVRTGQSLSRALERNALTTQVAGRMLRVGERSGRMGEMMERIATFHDEELNQWIDWLIRLVEPLLMVFIGLVIGVIVLLMYFPIFELAGGLQ